MKIFFAASEMTPYAKTGGLGDVVGALPRKLLGLGHEVTCCLPFYRQVREATRGANLHPPQAGKPPAPPQEGSGAPGGRALPTVGMPLPQMTLKIPLGKRVVTGDVVELKRNDGVRVLFVRCDQFFDRPELYQAGDRDYDDNAERFLFFSKAVAELIGDERFRPDVVHCHDWQTALVPVLMRQRQGERPQPGRSRHQPQAGTPVPPRAGDKTVAAGFSLRGKDAPVKGAATEGPGLIGTPKTVFTVHNIAYQGIFSGAAFPLTNLPGEFFTTEALEFYGQMNLMKGGIVFADAITTVSRKYAEEIQTPAGGFGLEGVLQTRADDLYGIMNGVDYTVWNPETDQYLNHRYSIKDLSGKRACRADLLERLGIRGSGFKVKGSRLPTSGPSLGGEREGTTTGETPVPLLGFVSRLAEQKGVEVLVRAIDDLVRSGVVLAILGKGERKYEEMLMAAAKRFPGQVVVKIAHDEELAHQIQAGADMLLVPSRFEPCGLTQLYALKYGTIPVVRATGGLEDTVVQYNERTGEGTGFKFALYESAALVEAVRRAILLHKQPKKWEKLMRNAMACDFSWQASAKEYEKLYAAL